MGGEGVRGGESVNTTEIMECGPWERIIGRKDGRRKGISEEGWLQEMLFVGKDGGRKGWPEERMIEEMSSQREVWTKARMVVIGKRKG